MQQLRASIACVLALCVVAVSCPTVSAETVYVGKRVYDHGVATPISNHRGTVATVDGNGRNVLLSWLMDHRGGYGLLVLDVATGEGGVKPMPSPIGDSPFASILSSGNKFYTHVNSHFVEYDPVKGDFSFCVKTERGMAMGMTEDDNGIIWSVTYPQSGVVSFNPATREFKDYGHVYEQNWAQYQRDVACDDTGWLYFGVGSTNAQIIALNPETGEALPMLSEEERKQGTGTVYRNLDGKVYGKQSKDPTWYQFYQGERTTVGTEHQKNAKPIITSHQGLFHRTFPNGDVVTDYSLVDRTLSVKDAETGEISTVSFDYESEGAHLMGIATAQDGTLCGGTAFPMRFFSYNPSTDEWINRQAYGQWNTVTTQGEKFLVGGYGGGFLLEWDPAEEWGQTVKGDPEGNPLFLTQCTPTIHRPHDLYAHPDGKTIILAGTPGYGYTGGGLLFWDRETGTQTLLEHTDIIPQHSTMCLMALPGNKLLGGTTIGAGTGGEVKATVAELYVMDMATRQVEWHEPLIPEARSYGDMTMLPNGMVLCIADRVTFFVFDPVTRTIIHQQNTEEAGLGKTNWQQGPRVFVRGPNDEIYMLFTAGVAQVDPVTYEITMLSQSPIAIGPGGDYYRGRIYFSNGSHLYSYRLPGLRISSERPQATAGHAAPAQRRAIQSILNRTHTRPWEDE